MLLSAVSVLVVAQSISEIPEGLMNNPVFQVLITIENSYVLNYRDVVESYFSLRPRKETIKSLMESPVYYGRRNWDC